MYHFNLPNLSFLFKCTTYILIHSVYYASMRTVLLSRFITLEVVNEAQKQLRSQVPSDYEAANKYSHLR